MAKLLAIIEDLLLGGEESAGVAAFFGCQARASHTPQPDSVSGLLKQAIWHGQACERAIVCQHGPVGGEDSAARGGDGMIARERLGSHDAIDRAVMQLQSN